MQKIKIGSRKSQLAMWQAQTVSDILRENGMDSEIVQIQTRGDIVQDAPIAAIGGRGVFTQELEAQLENGGIDIAVHSAKDMPSQLGENFSLIAFTKREKVNDVLVSADKALCLENPEQAITVGTSSVRRVAMLRHHFPHVKTVEMRGNLQTRLKKMEAGQCDALMLAYAGVTRMGFDHLIVKTFCETQLIPAVGQGALAIEAAATMNPALRQRLRDCLNHPETEMRLVAERAFLNTLQGGCSIPVFALAQPIDDATLRLSGGLISLDGRQIIHRTDTAHPSQADTLGRAVGRYILEHNGRELLTEIRHEQSRMNMPPAARG